MANDYRETLNLPKTDFPMKADLAKREPAMLEKWRAMDIYGAIQRKPASRGQYILHDGPPYSNSPVHIGTALNKMLKDFVVKFKTMRGFNCPYVPGNDNHGMPIENEVTKALRAKQQEIDRLTIRKACRAHVQKFMKIQTEQFQRLGVFGEWDNQYFTMDRSFEATIVRMFGRIVERGYVYRGLRPVLWCPVDETALAEAEVEYREHTSNSIFVRFPLMSDPNGVFEKTGEAYALIWTTTPWTIPANMALAASPEFDYALVKAAGATLLILEALAPSVMEQCGVTDYEVVRTLPGAKLDGLVCKHPIFDRASPMLVVEQDHKGHPFVSATDGTGIVHIAPGHGEADFHLGVARGIEVLNPVDSRGRFTEGAGEFAGMDARGDGGKRVIERLREEGNLLAHHPYQHQYPHCWRCHSALMFRATVQWFMNIDHEGHRQKCLDAIERVKWFPASGQGRIRAMVENRPDWCLSRQRTWGVGIPAFYCRSCEEPLLTKESIESVAALVEREGADAWFTTETDAVLPADAHCAKCGGTIFDKDQDVLDVWFDSGSTHAAVLDNNDKWPTLRWPADLYLEGSDQHRGWFNTSLMTAMAVKGAAPYGTVVTHGFILDEQGYKMSKSRGNALEPIAMCNKYGADVLRLWAASTTYFEDVSISETILQNVATGYRDIRNTLRYCLANLYDFTPADSVPHAEMQELDRWALARLAQVIAAAAEAYENFDFASMTQTVNQFITVDLSPFYLDVLKDRLYASRADSPERRSAQTALFCLASALTRMLAPILSHTAEEMWGFMPIPDKKLSIHLETFPEPDREWNDDALLGKWAKLLLVRDAVGPAIETWRISFRDEATGAKAKDSAEAMVTLSAGKDLFELLQQEAQTLSSIFKVAKVELRHAERDMDVQVALAPGAKCARCWLIREDVANGDLCARCAEVLR